MNTRIASFVVVALLLAPYQGQAQSIELGVQVVGSQWSGFKGTDLGIGGRFAWQPMPVIGIETEVNWYPREFPVERAAFSGHRLEGVLALTAGPRLGRVRPFVRAGVGFLKSSPAPAPFVCIAIFPPPLACLMAGGHTLPTLELGGGLEFATPGSTFLRIDAGDRMLRYPGPTFTRGLQQLKDQDFFGHAFRFAFGGGWRF